MKILVFGASSFIGSEFLKLAVQDGTKVFFPILPESSQRRLGNLIGLGYRLDSRDSIVTDQAFEEACLEFEPEILLDFSWQGVQGDARNSSNQIENLRLSMDRLKFGIKVGVSRYVGIGSQAEYGPANRRVSELDACNPTTLYGITKLATHLVTKNVCDEANVKYSWIRVFSTYGIGDAETWLIPSLVSKLLKGQNVELTSGEQLWDYLHVTDAARAIHQVCRLVDGAGLVNLGSGDPIEIKEVARLIDSKIDRGGRLQFGAKPFRDDQIFHLEADRSKLTRLTGWVPKVRLEDGLSELINEVRLRIGQV